MLLREYLEEHTRDELLSYARSIELKKCSGLRKAELIEKIVADFCAENVLRSRLTCLTKEEMKLFRKVCDGPQDISANEVMDSMQLSVMYWLGGFEKTTDRFVVFEEIAQAFSAIDDEAFQREQNKKGWMIKCIRFFMNYYGIAPIEVIYKLYRLKVKDTIDEMIDMLWEMPIDIVKSCLFSLERLGMQNWPKEDPIYSARGLLIHLPILENHEFNSLLDEQADKSFYIPSAQQLDEICCRGYEASALAYKKLEKYFIKEMNMPYEHATTWCLQVWANSMDGESPAAIINKMTEAGIEFHGEKQMGELVGLLMDAHNNTRMIENRGHKPIELSGSDFSDGMPIIVPGSSKAAGMLRESVPYLNKMGIPVDLDGNAVKVEKKIYPNDPCPCGSGKKYKKCCGRK